MHKTANVLDKLPKGQQPKAKRAMHEIWMAETKAAPSRRSTSSSRPTRRNTRRRPMPGKDRDALLAFYDFPAEHWKHLRTTNPIESTFATVRHRTSGRRASSPAWRASRWSSNCWRERNRRSHHR